MKNQLVRRKHFDPHTATACRGGGKQWGVGVQEFRDRELRAGCGGMVGVVEAGKILSHNFNHGKHDSGFWGCGVVGLWDIFFRGGGGGNGPSREIRAGSISYFAPTFFQSPAHSPTHLHHPGPLCMDFFLLQEVVRSGMVLRIWLERRRLRIWGEGGW